MATTLRQADSHGSVSYSQQQRSGSDALQVDRGCHVAATSAEHGPARRIMEAPKRQSIQEGKPPEHLPA